ncbi:hypothetical protein [Asticcacaulis sp.]|uniref:hypothetical protein n=1 Tax=Asticcacaulis sp. TaxID=1872648 RepID=UPI003F7B9853
MVEQQQVLVLQRRPDPGGRCGSAQKTMDIIQHGNSLRIFWQGGVLKSSRPFRRRRQVVTNVNNGSQEICMFMQNTS